MDSDKISISAHAEDDYNCRYTPSSAVLIPTSKLSQRKLDLKKESAKWVVAPMNNLGRRLSVNILQVKMISVQPMRVLLLEK